MVKVIEFEIQLFGAWILAYAMKNEESNGLFLIYSELNSRSNR